MHLSRPLRRALVAAALVTLAVATHGQAVTPPSTPANCVQNADNLDLACGSGAVARPGTGTAAFGINAKANGDAATAIGERRRGADLGVGGK
jgi:hypothetical protein